MNTDIKASFVQQALEDTQATFQAGASQQRSLLVSARTASGLPYPSPADWRTIWIYFLMIDRFNNPAKAPAGTWNQKFDFRQGGTFKGIEQQLDYIASLGAGAIWISPVLKNAKPEWAYSYHGYATQDFMSLDGRFASDGTEATAEKELKELVDAAHARGLYVILDIVINHTARVFDYWYQNQLRTDFSDAGILNGPLGDEPPIQWLNGFGFPRPDWQDGFPAGTALSPDDAVWPADLHEHKDFFRRRGDKLSDAAGPGNFARGDFGSMRQLVVEYLADANTQPELRAKYGKTPVLNILITAYTYLIAKFDIDGFRIDTVKYVAPSMVQIFGNAIREYALSIGKRNFFTFGEIYDNEQTIRQFIGRNTTDSQGEGFGIDAALDFPLFFALPAVIKGFADVATVREVFDNRKKAENTLLSSHGEAGKYFVTFLDNHDQNQRFNQPGTPVEQVLSGLAVLFCLQGIPCLYYGTEQGLNGTKKKDGSADLTSLESVREALWGKKPAFGKKGYFYHHTQALGKLRRSEPALQYGRLYFREVSGNGTDFGHPYGAGSLLAFSRILYATEILVVVNTSFSTSFHGFVVLDSDINRAHPLATVVYSNIGTVGQGTVQTVSPARFYEDDKLTGIADTAALFIKLAPMEVQIIKVGAV